MAAAFCQWLRLISSLLHARLTWAATAQAATASIQPRSSPSPSGQLTMCWAAMAVGLSWLCRHMTPGTMLLPLPMTSPSCRWCRCRVTMSCRQQVCGLVLLHACITLHPPQSTAAGMNMMTHTQLLPPPAHIVCLNPTFSVSVCMKRGRAALMMYIPLQPCPPELQACCQCQGPATLAASSYLSCSDVAGIGKCVNSSSDEAGLRLDGTATSEAKKFTIQWLQDKGIGTSQVCTHPLHIYVARCLIVSSGNNFKGCCSKHLPLIAGGHMATGCYECSLTLL